MQIDMYETANCDWCGGGPELHLRALQNTLADLPRVVLALTPDQQVIWRRYVDQPRYYYVADTTKESHGFKYDDEWHFPKKHFIQED